MATDHDGRGNTFAPDGFGPIGTPPVGPRGLLSRPQSFLGNLSIFTVGAAVGGFFLIRTVARAGRRAGV